MKSFSRLVPGRRPAGRRDWSVAIGAAVALVALVAGARTYARRPPQGRSVEPTAPRRPFLMAVPEVAGDDPADGKNGNGSNGAGSGVSRRRPDSRESRDVGGGAV